MSLHEVPGDYFKRRKTDDYEPTYISNTAFSLCMTLNLDEIGVIDNYVILTIPHQRSKLFYFCITAGLCSEQVSLSLEIYTILLLSVVLQCTLNIAVPMRSWLVSCIPTGSPSSSSASSFCFNEAPGRFWKALELNAVHPVQTAASSSVPASLDQTLHYLLHTTLFPQQLQTGRGQGPVEYRAMISTDVTTRRQQKGSALVSLQRDSPWKRSTGNTFYILSGFLLWVIIFNRAKHEEDLSWLKVSPHKIQEIDATLYDNLFNPAGICTLTACLCILLLSWPCVMSTKLKGCFSSLLIGRRLGIVLDHSQGKCLGTPLPSVRGDREQNGSREAQPVTPLSAKYAEVTGFLLGKS